MFVPLVALWFGALFSLSSLAVRTGLFEQTIVAIGVDQVFPYASPPLGHTARLLIAAAFGLLGAALGALLAKAVAGGQRRGGHVDDSAGPLRSASADDDGDYRVRARDAHPDAPARRPISASTELGKMEPESDPAERPFAPWALHAPAAETEEAPPPLPEWFTPAPAGEGAAPNADGAEAGTPETSGEAPAIALSPPAEPIIAGASGEVTDPDYPEAWRNTAERIAHAPPAALGHVELIERLAMALNRQPEGEEAARPAAGPDATATIQALRDALTTLRGS
jgi:hypothetical protein